MRTIHDPKNNAVAVIWSNENADHITAADQTISELHGLGYTIAQITGNGKQWQAILTKEPKQ